MSRVPFYTAAIQSNWRCWNSDFGHGSANNIDTITDFICQRLDSPCKAPQATLDACQQGRTAAASKTGQAAADAFNAALGVYPECGEVYDGQDDDEDDSGDDGTDDGDDGTDDGTGDDDDDNCNGALDLGICTDVSLLSGHLFIVSKGLTPFSFS